MEHVSAADRIARDHRHHGFRQPADLDLEVEDVQATDACRIDVAVVASDALVATRAECLSAGAGQDDDADGRIVARGLESAGHLEDGGGPEGVAHLGPVDGDPCDAVPGVVEDVLVVA